MSNRFESIEFLYCYKVWQSIIWFDGKNQATTCIGSFV